MGFGTISADIDFADDTHLLADDGILTLSGTIEDLGATIGTDSPTGTLLVTNPWNTNLAGELRLSGGEVTGAEITNGGLTTGFGMVTNQQIRNTGTIAADGGTLTIDTVAAPDLDGLGLFISSSLEAVNGDIQVVDLPNDPVNGAVIVGPSRTITFNAGWTLGTGTSTGVLTLNAGANAVKRAGVAGGLMTLEGDVRIDQQGVFFSVSDFASTVNVSLDDADDVLRLVNKSVIRSGATFSGDGSLIAEATLKLEDGASVDVGLIGGGLLAIGTSPGSARALSYSMTRLGQLEIEMGGLDPGTQYDQLIIDGDVALDGDLLVSIIAPFEPGPAQRFEIIDVGGALTGIFAGLAEGGQVGAFGNSALFITYMGGDGNDVVLFTPEPTVLLLLLLLAMAIPVLATHRRTRHG